MRNILAIICLFACWASYGQSDYNIFSNKVTLKSFNSEGSELWILNNTKDSIGGIATNVGGGHLSYKYLAIDKLPNGCYKLQASKDTICTRPIEILNLGDSLAFVYGDGDTSKYSVGDAGIALKYLNGLSISNDTIKIGGEITENTEWSFSDKSFKMKSDDNTEFVFNSEETLNQLFPEIKVTGFSSRTDIDEKEMLTFTGLGKVEDLGQEIYTPVSALNYGDGYKVLAIFEYIFKGLAQNDFQPIEIGLPGSDADIEVPFLIDDIGTLIARTVTYDEDKTINDINCNIVESDNGFDVYISGYENIFDTEEEQFIDAKYLFVFNFTTANSDKQTVSFKRMQNTEYNDDGLSLDFVDLEQDKGINYLFGLDGLQIDEKFIEATGNYLDLKDFEDINNPNIYQPDYEKSNKFYFDVNGLTPIIAAPWRFQDGEQLRIDIYNTDSNTVTVQFDGSYQVDHYTGETFGYGGSNFTMNVAENEDYQLYVTKSQSGKLLLQVIKYPDN